MLASLSACPVPVPHERRRIQGLTPEDLVALLDAGFQISLRRHAGHGGPAGEFLSVFVGKRVHNASA